MVKFSDDQLMTVVSLDNEFGRRFADFQQLKKEFNIALSPLTFDTENSSSNLQLELIELQCDSTL